MHTHSTLSYTHTHTHRSDFAIICRRYRLNYKQVMDYMGGDGKGRFSLDAFIHYMKRCQHSSQAQHSLHQTNYYDQESYTRPTSPIHRPSSAGKHTRTAVHSSASSGHHHSRMSTRYPVSPVTGVYNEQETFTPEDHHYNKRRQDMTRTPDVSFVIHFRSECFFSQYMRVLSCGFGTGTCTWHACVYTLLCAPLNVAHVPPPSSLVLEYVFQYPHSSLVCVAEVLETHYPHRATCMYMYVLYSLAVLARQVDEVRCFIGGEPIPPLLGYDHCGGTFLLRLNLYLYYLIWNPPINV